MEEQTCHVNLYDLDIYLCNAVSSDNLGGRGGEEGKETLSPFIAHTQDRSGILLAMDKFEHFFPGALSEFSQCLLPAPEFHSALPATL